MNIDTSQSTDKHQEFSLLLPWYLNQSLEQAERQQVENHLQSCMLCRQELVILKKLALAVKRGSEHLDVAAEASFSRLREKLQTAPTQKDQLAGLSQPVSLPRMRNDGNSGLLGNATHRHKPFWDFLGHQGTRLAIAASVLLAIIPFAVRHGRLPKTKDEYYTLSDAKPESTSDPRLRVVFSKSMSDTDINALLARINGQRIEGPNSVGAYTVRLDDGEDAPELAAALAFLRSQPDIMLAEPVMKPSHSAMNILRLSLFICLLALLSACTNYTYSSRVGDSSTAEDRRLVVTFVDRTISRTLPGNTLDGYRIRSQYSNSGWSERVARKLADRHQLQIIAQLPLTALGISSVVYEVPEQLELEQVMVELQNDREVTLVQRMQSFPLLGNKMAASEFYRDSYPHV